MIVGVAGQYTDVQVNYDNGERQDRQPYHFSQRTKSAAPTQPRFSDAGPTVGKWMANGNHADWHVLIRH